MHTHMHAYRYTHVYIYIYTCIYIQGYASKIAPPWFASFGCPAKPKKEFSQKDKQPYMHIHLYLHTYAISIYIYMCVCVYMWRRTATAKNRQGSYDDICLVVPPVSSFSGQLLWVLCVCVCVHFWAASSSLFAGKSTKVSGGPPIF